MIGRRGPNEALLAAMATYLGDLRERLVFVGGCATGVLLTDPGAGAVRVTQDVDTIVEVTSVAEYYSLSEQLTARGFRQELQQGAPPYRWHINNLMLDVMPTDERILGFSNRWYRPAMHASQNMEIADGLSIRMISPPYFVATKLEAFFGRGRGDYLASADLEDFLAMVDGRQELTAEIAAAAPDLRRYLSEKINGLLAIERFLDAVSAHIDIGSPLRSPVVLERLRAIARA